VADASRGQLAEEHTQLLMQLGEAAVRTDFLGGKLRPAGTAADSEQKQVQGIEVSLPEDLDRGVLIDVGLMHGEPYRVRLFHVEAPGARLGTVLSIEVSVCSLATHRRDRPGSTSDIDPDSRA
jgi:hypothetical protein